ncbi:hypothetical protein GI364_04165 [Alicyclobacillus sp. SO9]|nr:hypothetical protein GI364_04165 [Alicyclobacillus sp. SO9]
MYIRFDVVVGATTHDFITLVRKARPFTHHLVPVCIRLLWSLLIHLVTILRPNDQVKKEKEARPRINEVDSLRLQHLKFGYLPASLEVGSIKPMTSLCASGRILSNKSSSTEPFLNQMVPSDSPHVEQIISSVFGSSATETNAYDIVICREINSSIVTIRVVSCFVEKTPYQFLLCIH